MNVKGSGLLLTGTIINTVAVVILILLSLFITAETTAVPEVGGLLGILWLVLLYAVVLCVLYWVGWSQAKKGSRGWALFFIIMGIISIVEQLIGYDGFVNFLIGLIVPTLFIVGGSQVRENS